MTAASVTLAAICIAITLFSLTVAAVAVRMARKEIAHSRNVVALNRGLTKQLLMKDPQYQAWLKDQEFYGGEQWVDAPGALQYGYVENDGLDV